MQTRSQLLGLMIKQQRNEEDLTQLELAELSGYSRCTIIEIENGITHPCYFTVIDIMESMGCEVAYNKKGKNSSEKRNG